MLDIPHTRVDATTGMAGAAISVRNLGKVFKTGKGPVTALAGVDITVQPGQMLVLLGPSGCGKTTLLRCMAGLETPDTGSVEIAGITVSEPATGTEVPPEQRNLGMMFQSYALWPHMTVFRNIAYPLRNRENLDRATLQQRVTDILKSVGLAGLEERYPSELSGGQQQRVALARALVASPSALLFDEPLSNVDAQVRRRLRARIRDMKEARGFAGAYVTHDQEEAMALADILAVMKDGSIVQMGPPDVIYRRPASLYVANFVGEANVIEGRVLEAGPALLTETAIGPLLIEGSAPQAVGDKGHVVLRPEVLRVADGRGVNCITGIVREMMMLGPHVELSVEVGGTLLRAWQNSFDLGGVQKGGSITLTFAPANASWVTQ
ncbi:MAG TPA: ABC transporter ATP-binding protein [Devosiaceae bacterium]